MCGHYTVTSMLQNGINFSSEANRCCRHNRRYVKEHRRYVKEHCHTAANGRTPQNVKVSVTCLHIHREGHPPREQAHDAGLEPRSPWGLGMLPLHYDVSMQYQKLQCYKN